MTVTNPFGIPIEGTITKGHSRIEQRPIEALRPLLEAVLAHDEVEAIRWRQYTPYFNDGDECVFGVEADWDFVKLRGVKEDETEIDDEEEADFLEIIDPRIKGGKQQKYIPAVVRYDEISGRRREIEPARWEDVGVRERSPAYDDLYALSHAIGSGHYDDALYELFGDHARVTVTREKIVVEEYSHD